MSDMSAAPRRHRCCPICNRSVRQANRSAEDDATPVAPGMRRFRCREADCGWEGTLARRHRLAKPSRRSERVAASAAERTARQRAARFSTAILLLLTAVIAGTIVWARDLPLPFIGARGGRSSGQACAGSALPSGHPPLTWAALQPRSSPCPASGAQTTVGVAAPSAEITAPLR